MTRATFASALDLLASQRQAGLETKKLTLEGYGRLGQAHALILEAMAEPLIKLQSQNRLVPDPSNGHRLMLFASLFIGMPLVEDAIAQGRYLQAHALVRQEMETLARLVEVRKGIKKLEYETPRVSHLEQSVRRLYGELTEAAHVSTIEALRGATVDDDHPSHPDTFITRFYPALDLQLARKTFGLHLFLWLYIIEELTHYYGEDEAFGDRERKLVLAAIAIMRDENILEVASWP